MSLTNNPLIPLPPRATKIWRYVSFWNLANLLQREALWFSRASDLGDAFEGSAPTYARSELPAGAAEQLSSARRNIRPAMYVSCWSESRHESAALWDLYGKGGIAVTSTVGRLVDAIGDYAGPMTVGRVKYINYDRPQHLDPTILDVPYFRKRPSFKHEHEVRALTWTEFGDVFKGAPETEPGLYVPVLVRRLVTDVYVSPKASAEFAETVRQLITGHGCRWRVQHSALDDPAVF